MLRAEKEDADMNETANRIPALFGSCVFNEETMQQYIQPAAMDAWRSCLQ